MTKQNRTTTNDNRKTQQCTKLLTWSFCEQTKPNETKAWLRGLLSQEARKWGLHRATFDWLELFKYLCTGDRACSKTEIRLSKHQMLSCQWSNLSVTNARQKYKMLMTQKTMSARFSSVVPFAHKWTQFKMSVTREGCSTCQVPVILHLWEHFSYKLHSTVKHTMEKKHMNRDRFDPCSGSESEADSPKSNRSRSNGNRKLI